MPSASPKQKRFMQAVAHNPEFAKKAGVPQKVGKEYAAVDKRAQGRPDLQGVNNPKTDHGSMALFKRGGTVNSEKAKEERHASTLRQLAKEEQAEANKMARGGSVKKSNLFAGKESAKEEKAEKKMPPWMYKKGERSEGEGMACGGKVKKMAAGGSASSRADGVAQRGKTRGKFC